MIACPNCGKPAPPPSHFYPKSGKPRCHRFFWNRGRLAVLRDCLESGLTDEQIGRAMGITVVAVNLARKRHGIPSRTELLLTATEIAKRMGVKCSKTVARWIEAGWLRGWQGPPRGGNRQYCVHASSLYDFLRDRRHWHRWEPERIADEALRRYALSVRGGERFLTVGEVAERMCCQVGTVSQWIRKGQLPAVKQGNNWRVREGDLARFELPTIGWRKPSWDPCVACGDPDGRVAAGCVTPTRHDGRQFGIVGKLCYRCYRREKRAQRKAARSAAEERLAA